MKDVLMIINPNSGKANSKKNILTACEILSNHGYTIQLYFTRKKRDAYEYVYAHGEGFDIVLAVGGDGTLHEVTNGLMRLEKRPKLGYFPSGTMNDFAENFQLANDYIDIAHRIPQENTIPFDVGQFNQNDYFNYVAGFGSFTDVSYKTPREAKESLGSLAYFLEGVNSLSLIQNTRTHIMVDDYEESVDVLFGIVFSGSRVAGLELSNRKSTVNDGTFNVLLVEYTPNLLDYGNYLALLSQQDNKYLHWYTGKHITFTFEDDITWTLDGEEVFGGKQAEIFVVNKALEMIA